MDGITLRGEWVRVSCESQRVSGLVSLGPRPTRLPSLASRLSPLEPRPSFALCPSAPSLPLVSLPLALRQSVIPKPPTYHASAGMRDYSHSARHTLSKTHILYHDQSQNCPCRS